MGRSSDKMVYENPTTSGANLQTLAEQIKQITAQLQTSEQRRQQLEIRIEAMTQSSEQRTSEREDIESFDQYEVNPPCEEPDVIPDIQSGDEIQLESYKAIPEFSGKQHEYRSWRGQVAQRMKIIDRFKKHVKYEAALAIVRAKVTGTAADVLTNNKTPYNIICILKTLDSAFTDQRPLYAIEAQMVAIRQNEKNLREFYNAINFALNAIIAKIVTSYKDIKEQRSLVAEAQKKAIRTFIVGLKFRMMRHILYGQQPKTLQEAYAIAQTVFYDNEHLHLEQGSATPRGQPQQQRMTNNWNKPGMSNGNQPRNNNGMNNYNQPEKRENNFPRQRSEQQQPQKVQRINHLMDEATPEEPTANDGNDSDNSAYSNESSAFLDE